MKSGSNTFLEFTKIGLIAEQYLCTSTNREEPIIEEVIGLYLVLIHRYLHYIYTLAYKDVL